MLDSLKRNRKWLWLAIIVLLGLWLFNYVTTQIKDLKTEASPAHNKEFSLEKAHEDRVQEAIALLLQRLVGKNGYYAAVNVILRYDSEEEVGYELDPSVVTENFSYTIDGSYDQNDKAFKGFYDLEGDDNKPETAPEPAQPEFEDDTFVALPGFPKLSVPLDPYFEEEIKENALKPTTNEREQNESISLAENKNKSVIFYNRKDYKRITPMGNIDKIKVSVVVDNERFTKRGLNQDDLYKLVRYIAGLDESRGDEIHIAYMKINDSVVDWDSVSNSYLSFTGFLEKYYKPIVAFLLLFLLLSLSRRGYARLQDWATIRRLRNEAQKAADEAKDDQVTQVRRSVFNEQKEAISSLAQTEPEEMSKLLLNWMEADDVDNDDDTDEEEE